jgi:hypothetical protein
MPKIKPAIKAKTDILKSDKQTPAFLYKWNEKSPAPMDADMLPIR